MREKDLLSRREFIKTLAVGVGIAGTGTAGLTAVIKAAGSSGKLSLSRAGRGNFAAENNHCRVCEKALDCGTYRIHSSCSAFQLKVETQ
ncbi:twin-arginine translocation signal domain-containing protein [bacterium]|nr:twin-arginine translocation signal domain-containing protein [bacterium]